MAKKPAIVSASASVAALPVSVVPTPTTAPVPAVTLVAAAPSKSDLIRDYHAKNPNAGPSEIAKALSTDTNKFSAALVGQVINGRANNGKASKGGLNVEMIKAASAFVKSYEGNIEDAAAAIESVGQFIDACGGSQEALQALTTFKDLTAAIA